MSGIHQMGSEQCGDGIILNVPLQRGETDPLQHTVTGRISNDVLLKPVEAVTRRVGDGEGRNAWRVGTGFGQAVALFFGEITFRPRDNEDAIAGTGAVNAWIIDFVENAVAQGEPDARV